MNRAAHPFTLRQLQYAIAVAEERSFRRAAERSGVSQPSLSAQIAQLESALEVRLFERDRRRVLLTAAGRDLLERARRLVVDADALLEAGRRARDPHAGTIRLGVIPTIAPYLLPEAVPHLRARFPRLTLAWREDKTANLIAALRTGELDAALLALEAELGDVEREIIARDAFVLVASPEHPLARRGSAVDEAELRGAEVLFLDDGHCFRDQALEICAAAHAREGEFRATSLTTLVQMVVGGAGVTLVPEMSLATELGRSRLRVRPIASPKAHRTIGLVWRRHAPVAAALHEIAAVLRTAFPAPAAGRSNRRPKARPAS